MSHSLRGPTAVTTLALCSYPNGVAPASELGMTDADHASPPPEGSLHDAADSTSSLQGIDCVSKTYQKRIKSVCVKTASKTFQKCIRNKTCNNA